MADRTTAERLTPGDGRRRKALKPLGAGALAAAALLVVTGCSGSDATNVSNTTAHKPSSKAPQMEETAPAGQLGSQGKPGKPARHGATPAASGHGGPRTGAGSKPSPTAPRKSAPSPAAPPPGKAAGGWWKPSPRTLWQWQLDGKVDTSVDVPVYDIDGFENDAETVGKLHADGRKVICYINVGAHEDWRPDKDKFPESVLGEKVEGWEGERWLDIRRTDILEPLMAERFDMCRKKGFDAVEPDLTEGYRNKTGFDLTADHQLAFNRMIARLAHQRGMSVGLKNDLDQIPELVGDFDFSVNEQCAEYGECDKLTPFVKNGKAVLHVEYKLTPDKFCSRSKELGLSSMQKKLGLNSWRLPC